MSDAPVSRFVHRFHAVHGRAPRVLHIGNIANNAYQNAKILNRHGFDCDVICYDYYHIMGCPEWEEVDFDVTIADHFRPDWTTVDLKGYERPRWFAQGPREYCIEYLVAKRTGKTRRASLLWRDLSWFNKSRPSAEPASGPLRALAMSMKYHASQFRRFQMRARARPDAYQLTWGKLEQWAAARGQRGFFLASLMAPLLQLGVLLTKLPRPGLGGGTTNAAAAPTIADKWRAVFRAEFPERPDQLSNNDVAPFLWAIPEWKRLFAHYDIVQAYATDVILPMLAEKHPYLGFEHGTLRVFTLADNALSRLTALGYHLAEHALITNGDCLEYAQKIRVQAYSPMLHPFDDDFMRGIQGDREGLRRQHGVERVFVCPLRHDWAIKGTDQYIRALPALADQIGRGFKVVMTEWGGQVSDSHELAETLGVADLIAWCPPFNRSQLIRMLKSVDIVFDQIALPCFGGTAPQAIACQVPVIMSYDPSSTAWLIPEPAPILTAWSAADVVPAVRTALDPAWRNAYEVRARRWYDRYHSSEQVLAKHEDAYFQVCAATGLLPAEKAAAS